MQAEQSPERGSKDFRKAQKIAGYLSEGNNALKHQTRANASVKSLQRSFILNLSSDIIIIIRQARWKGQLMEDSRFGRPCEDFFQRA
jgi:hypothetical protein